MRAVAPAMIVRPREVLLMSDAPCLDSGTCWVPLGHWRVSVVAVPSAAGAAVTVKVQLEPATTWHDAGATVQPAASAGPEAGVKAASACFGQGLPARGSKWADPARPTT